jgi:hypothetical protein
MCIHVPLCDWRPDVLYAQRAGISNQSINLEHAYIYTYVCSYIYAYMYLCVTQNLTFCTRNEQASPTRASAWKYRLVTTRAAHWKKRRNRGSGTCVSSWWGGARRPCVWRTTLRVTRHVQYQAGFELHQAFGQAGFELHQACGAGSSVCVCVCCWDAGLDQIPCGKQLFYYG